MKNDGLSDNQRALFKMTRRALVSLLRCLDDLLGVDRPAVKSREESRDGRFRVFTGNKKIKEKDEDDE